ncbi:MAG: hypothetical protein ACREMO_03800 [Gemmatimonadales bacterium]
MPIVCTALGTPAMMLARLPSRSEAPAHHGQHHGVPRPVNNDCCDACWAACSSPPSAPQGLTPVAARIVEYQPPLYPADPPSGAASVPHHLPFSIGPPALPV